MQIFVIANSKYFHQKFLRFRNKNIQILVTADKQIFVSKTKFLTIILLLIKTHLFIWSKITYDKDHTLEQRVEQVKLFTVKSRLNEKRIAANTGNHVSYSAQING